MSSEVSSCGGILVNTGEVVNIVCWKIHDTKMDVDHKKVLHNVHVIYHHVCGGSAEVDWIGGICVYTSLVSTMFNKPVTFTKGHHPIGLGVWKVLNALAHAHSLRICVIKTLYEVGVDVETK